MKTGLSMRSLNLNPFTTKTHKPAEIHTHILLVEDDKIDQLAFERMIKQDNHPYEYTIASSVEEGLRCLSSEVYDIIILDYMLGDGTAFDILNVVNDIPVIIITGGGGEEIAVKAMRAGAYDYLIKDRDRNYLKILPIIVGNAIRRQKAEAISGMLTHAMMNISDSVFITDLDDLIVFVNKAFCKTYGYTESEVYGTHADFLWNDITDHIHARELADSWEGEAIHKRKNGTSFPVSLTRTIIQEQNQSIIVGIARDITEKKRSEEALRRNEEALRIRNEVIEKDLSLAQHIQRALLSRKMTSYEKIKIHNWYHTIDMVGGDYFSLTPLREGGLGVFLGDVSGHGVAAALYLSLVKASTDRICRNHGLEPARYLQTLNQELLEYMPSSFLTSIYGYFKVLPKESKVVFTFAKGGHPYPILYRAGKSPRFEYIKSKGTLLGIYPNIKIEEVQVDLFPGDRIFLYTDGLSELTDSQGNLVSEEQLLDFFHSSTKSRLSKTIDTLISQIMVFRKGQDLEDDLILLGFEIE